MTRLFNFDARQYASTFASEGYAYIPEGLSEEFHALLTKQVEEYVQRNRLENFTLTHMQQSLYEFPQDQDYLRQLFEAVGAVAGLDPDKMVLSERHIKAYESDANPNPRPHKDRFASEVSIGFSVQVPKGSTLVLYPYDDVSVNPFNTAADLPASLPAHQQPEETLKEAQRIEIQDAPRDVVMFRGHSIWHLRTQSADTTMVYLKLNTFNCDPLGEDPSTPDVTQRTKELLALPDGELEKMIPLVGRRVDYVQRRYNRDWQEVIGVMLWGQKHLTIDEKELRALQAMNGQRTV
ncbi:MAG: hypothetical protein M3347_01150, partial [Armatimonadota bacterium]|nr:hypothetical protein [Armatimonadota bacterium]